MTAITPDAVLRAYMRGIFPMAETRDDPTLYWIDPDVRGILPLDDFHVPRRLSRVVRQDRFRITADMAFAHVMRGCASSGPGRRDTWINASIVRLYCSLNQMGFAHSVEAWRSDRLVGGLYGVAIGGAFFGESMFTRESNASKVALVHLVARLRHGGYKLLDTQFVTAHLASFGAIEVPRRRYHAILREAIRAEADFYSFGDGASGARVLQSITQTS